MELYQPSRDVRKGTFYRLLTLANRPLDNNGQSNLTP